MKMLKLDLRFERPSEDSEMEHSKCFPTVSLNLRRRRLVEGRSGREAEGGDLWSPLPC